MDRAGPRQRRAKMEIGKNTGAGEVSQAVPIPPPIAGPGIARVIVVQAELIDLTLHDGLMDDVADDGALVGEESIAVEGKDHLVGM